MRIGDFELDALWLAAGLAIPAAFVAWPVWRWYAKQRLLRPFARRAERTVGQVGTLYQRILPHLDELERMRITSARKISLWVAATVPVLAGLMYLLYDVIPAQPYFMFGLIAACAIFGGAYWFFVDYRNSFKHRIVGPLVRAIGLDYHPEGCIDRDTFVASHLFGGFSISDYRAEDLVSGTLGTTTMRFCEVAADEVIPMPDDKNETTSVFRGAFFMADFNKRFAGTTFVLEAMEVRRIRHGEPVKLEDPAFEGVFDVFASDQIEARYILSSALMRRIVAFRARCGRPMHISFVGDHVNIAIDGMKLFEPRLFRTLKDPSYYAGIQDDIDLLSGIVEDLNLNTRIWTKA